MTRHQTPQWFSDIATIYLWVLECHVNGKTRAKARQSLEVGGVGQRPTTLCEHGEGQRLEVLAVEVALPAVNWLQ